MVFLELAQSVIMVSATLMGFGFTIMTLLPALTEAVQKKSADYVLQQVGVAAIRKETTWLNGSVFAFALSIVVCLVGLIASSEVVSFIGLLAFLLGLMLLLVSSFRVSKAMRR